VYRQNLTKSEGEEKEDEVRVNLQRKRENEKKDTLWGVRSVVMFSKAFLACSTGRWDDIAATVQPNGTRDLQIQNWFQESIAGRQCKADSLTFDTGDLWIFS